MIAISTKEAVVEAIGHAHDVLLTAYTLPPGCVRTAIEQAAERGANVTVRLNGLPFRDDDGTLQRNNAGAIAQLRRRGADAKLVHTTDHDGPMLHMKAVVCDGVAFLDDRNWPADSADTIIRDDFARDVRAVRDAAAGKPDPPTPFFATTKEPGTHLEAALLYHAVHAREVDVESEAFGASPQVFGALCKLADAGVKCRLIVSCADVNGNSQIALDALLRRGVEVRSGPLDEKMAIVDRKGAWIGSVNATANYYTADEIDWSLRSNDAAVIKGLHSNFERNWKVATKMPPPPPPSKHGSRLYETPGTA